MDFFLIPALLWSASAKKSHHTTIQPPGEPKDSRAYREDPVLLQPPTVFSAARGDSMWASSRFQSCDQVSGIPLPFQLPNKRSNSISWLEVKPCLYKII